MLPWLRSLSCLQLQCVLGVSHRFLTLVLDSRYHKLNSIPPEMSMASPPMNSALAVGPDCSWISWSHGKAQVTDCIPLRFPYSLWSCTHTTCHFAGTKRNRGIFWKDGQNILMHLPPPEMGWSYNKAPCILPLSPVCQLASLLHRVPLQGISCLQELPHKPHRGCDSSPAKSDWTPCWRPSTSAVQCDQHPWADLCWQ